MKLFIRLVSVLLILGSAPCRAENDTIVHNFQALNAASKIKFSTVSVSHDVGKVNDGIVYTCKGSANAQFTSVAGEIVLNLGARMDSVTTTRISNLKEFRMINSKAGTGMTTEVKFKISTDSINWGSRIDLVDNSTSTIGATFSKGDYYVRIYNRTSSPTAAVYLYELWFITESEDCNCFVYTP